jgi:excinuclease ABC subunit B
MKHAMRNIQDDLIKQIDFFKESGRFLEAKRLEERTNFDLEMIRELGYCNGIENYSRYMDNRKPGTRPFCLIDYFPKDFITFVDESHVTLPQVRAMYGGDRARKINLVDYGFRLPAAMDNRPLTFDEFEGLTDQTIYVSATPADYEIIKSEGVVVEQLIRPTGLLDPIIDVRPCVNQIDDLLEEIDETVKKGSRVLVTTLTKRMAEEVDKYLHKLNIKSTYIHSEVKTLDRVEILRDLRMGVYDVLVGVKFIERGFGSSRGFTCSHFGCRQRGILEVSPFAYTDHWKSSSKLGRACGDVRGQHHRLYEENHRGKQQTKKHPNGV